MPSSTKSPKITLRSTEAGLTCKVGRAAAVLVTPRPCFPLSEPGTQLSLRDAEDKELALVADPSELDAESETALREALAAATFILEITSVNKVEAGHNVRLWHVETASGSRIFQTHLDHWPRALASGAFLIQDVADDLYHIPHPEKLDEESQKILFSFVG